MSIIDQEAAVNEAHIEYLESRLTGLRQKVATFFSDDAHRMLIEIIHHQGWTTLGEARFFEAALDSIEVQLDALKRDHQNLLRAARLVDFSN